MSASILWKDAICAVTEIQEENSSLNTQSHVPIFTTRTLELLLYKFFTAARKAFRVDSIPHSIVAVATFFGTGCSVHWYDWGFNADYNGETIYKDRREGRSNLFQMSLIDDGTK